MTLPPVETETEREERVADVIWFAGGYGLVQISGAAQGDGQKARFGGVALLDRTIETQQVDAGGKGAKAEADSVRLKLAPKTPKSDLPK